MKKILALAAAAALTAGVSAYAANPFSDVTADDWAYQAVSDLSAQGVVEGYPDGTFKGEKNMTRYELAQIVARLMAKEDQLNAEQQATIDKLAGEYADELANLGVRVSDLEKKVGNIYWSGNARMRYMTRDNNKTNKDAKWDGRIRLNVKGEVNENTYVQGRFVNNMNYKDSGDSSTTMDRIFVHHDFGAAGVTLGRFEADFGNATNGTWFYSNRIDGVEAQTKLGKVALNAGYGRFQDVTTTKAGVADKYIEDGKDKYEIKDVFYAQGKANLDFAKVGVDYIKFQGNNGAEILGGNLNVPVAKNLEVFGDYYVNTVAKGAGEGWQAGLGYSNFNKKKAGTFDLNVAYFHLMDDVYQGGTGTQIGDLLDSISGKHTFWLATGDLVLQKNVTLRAEYAFADSAKDKDAKDLDDAWAVSLNYAF